MSKLIKDKNGLWYQANNDITIKDFQFSLYDTSDLNIETNNGNAIVYLPVHNIKDIYEWYRIFKDSYSYSDNFDKYGFAMHYFFSKERGQSIKGWFPNLVEVKCASSSILTYYDDGLDYYRKSVDFIDTFTGITDFQLDGVTVYDTELVLLKDQFTEQLTLLTIDSLSNDQTYFIDITIDSDKYVNMFNNTTKIIVNTTSNEFIEQEVSTISYETIGLTKYVKITINESILVNATSLGSIDAGDWIKNSFETQNGIYKYTNNDLVLESFMTDKYKVYNQIVYCYQGLTQMNLQYYLRRDEDINSVNYSKYPISDNVQNLIYSLGEAYLIKFELIYSLKVSDDDNILNVDTECCECLINAAINYPNHPTGSPTYLQDEDYFKLLYLDNDVADKVFATDKNGIGSYKFTDTPIEFTDLINSGNVLEFKLFDKDGDDNVLLEYCNREFTNYVITPKFKFRNIIFNPGETHTNSYNSGSNLINITTNTVTINYNPGDDIFKPNSVVAGDQMILTLTYNINNVSKIAYKNTVLVENILANSTSVLSIEINPIFDDNFLNELGLSNTLTNSFDITLEHINVYGDTSVPSIDPIKVLLQQLNKSIVGKFYWFATLDNDNNLLNGDEALYIKALRQQSRYKWFNYGCEILVNGSDNYYVEHKVRKEIRKYFYGHTIQDYLSNYVGTDTVSLPQLREITAVCDQVPTSPSFFDTYGDTRVTNKGNLIYFGSAYKELIIDNIKPYTYMTYQNLSGPTDTDIFVYSVKWDDVLGYGIIETMNYFDRPSTGHVINLIPTNDITTISNKFDIVFDKRDNFYNTPNADKNYKPDTSSLAYAMMNYGLNNLDELNADILTHITGIMFKEYNEPRVSFLKRDRLFKFDNNAKINVRVRTYVDGIGGGNITFIGTNIVDGVLLVAGNRVLVDDQINVTENGLYEFDGTDLIRVTDELVFNLKTNYLVTDGTHINKQYITKYSFPLNFGTTEINFYENYYKTKKDDRLSLKPLEIYKLGVDNKTRPGEKVTSLFDFFEDSENQVSVGQDINNINNIRFIDGLNDYDILNDVNGQGQYAWILDQNVVIANAIIGCTQEFGPGTGRLIWYTGTWFSGTWCDGIWYQGTWHSGTWVSGERYAYPIVDNFYYVSVTPTTNHFLSPWTTGTWFKGIWSGGIATDIVWHYGIFNNGIIKDGLWYNGYFRGGIIEHIIWEHGVLSGGDFGTGIWKDGILDGDYKGTVNNIYKTNVYNVDALGNAARFGVYSIGHISGDTNPPDYSEKAIWIRGIFNEGELHTGGNTANIMHNGTIFYSGNILNSTIYSGTIVSTFMKNTIVNNVVWIGGYKAATLVDGIGTNKKLTCNPSQYDALIGVSDCAGYIANSVLNLNHSSDVKYKIETPTPITQNNIINYNNYFTITNKNYYLIADSNSVSTFKNEAFINKFHEVTDGTYAPKQLIAYTNNTIQLDITATSANTTTYITEVPGTVKSGQPIVCSVALNCTINSCTWLNGVIIDTLFKRGIFVTGFGINTTFGEY